MGAGGGDSIAILCICENLDWKISQKKYTALGVMGSSDLPLVGMTHLLTSYGASSDNI